MPKLYFYDAGLAAWLLGIRTKEQMITHPLRGNLFETFIIAELVKSKFNKGEKPAFFFWRDSNGNEVDLIVEQETKLIPIEIKSGLVTKAKSLAVFSEKYHPKYRVIFSAKNLYCDHRLNTHYYPIYLAEAWPNKQTS